MKRNEALEGHNEITHKAKKKKISCLRQIPNLATEFEKKNGGGLLLGRLSFVNPPPN